MGEPALVSIGAVAFFFESSAKFCFVFVGVGLAAITVTGGEHGCDSRHENLQEVMQRPIAGFARVVHFSETAHQACPPRQSHFCRPKDQSRTDFARVYKLLA